MAISLSERPQLQFLTAQIDELKQKGTHFRLRILDCECVSSLNCAEWL